MKLCSYDTKGIWGVVTFGFLWWESTFIPCFEGFLCILLRRRGEYLYF